MYTPCSPDENEQSQKRKTNTQEKRVGDVHDGVTTSFLLLGVRKTCFMPEPTQAKTPLFVSETKTTHNKGFQETKENDPLYFCLYLKLFILGVFVNFFLLF